MIQNVVSWTRASPRYMHALFLESCWIHNSSLQFPVTESVFVPSLLGMIASIGTSNFLLDGFFMFSIFRITEINVSQSWSIVEFWLLNCPLLLFSLLNGVPNFGPFFKSHILRSDWCLSFDQSLRDLMYVFGGFPFNKVNFVNPFQESDKTRFAFTFQQSSIRFWCNKSRFV